MQTPVSLARDTLSDLASRQRRWVAAFIAGGVAIGLLAGLTAALYAAPVAQRTPRGGVITIGDAVSVEKRVELEGDATVARPGDVLTYTVVITNNDVATLPGIVVTDDLASLVGYVPGSTELDEGSGFAAVADNPTPPVFPLASGLAVDDIAAGAAVSLRYRVQVTDVVPAGVTALVNTVEVLALAESVTTTLSTPVLGNPGLGLEKWTGDVLSDAPPGVLVRSGEPISWTYRISNTGAVSLTLLSVEDSDPAVTPTLTLGHVDVGPGGEVVFAAEGIAVAGAYSNTAQAVGESALGEVVTATATGYYFGIAPELTLDKSAEVTTVVAGTPVTYTYRVTNTGNVSLTQVTVVDDSCGPLVWAGDGELPEERLALEIDEAGTFACTAVLTATTANTAVATALDPLDGVVTATTTITVAVPRAELTLIKTPSAGEVAAGAPVTYTYQVSNTGDFTITAISLVDDRCSPVTVLPGDAQVITDGLAPGSGAGFECTAVITEPTTNIATVTGIDPFSNTITATATAFVNVPPAGIELEKVPSSLFVTRDGAVTYTYTATNTGTISWTAVSVEDDRCAPVTPAVNGAGIAPAQSAVFTCTANLRVGTRNVATATATVAGGEVVTATAEALVRVTFYWIPFVVVAPVPVEPVEPVACPLPAGCAVPGVPGVKALAVHEGLNRLYVLSQATERLYALDAATFEVVGEAVTGAQPWDVAVNESANRVFVSNFGGGSVSVWDATMLALVATIPVGGSPGQMAVFPTLDTVLVLTRPDSRVVAIQGLAVVQDISAGGSGPFGIVADRAAETAYVSHRDSGSLSLIRREGGVWGSAPGPVFGDGRQYFSVDWNPTTGKLYVAAAQYTNPDAVETAWRVEVWQPSITPPWSFLAGPAVPSGGELAAPDVGGAGLVVNSATKRIYVANTGAGGVSVLEGVNDTPAGILATAEAPFALALHEANQVLFVGFRSSGNVAKVEIGP